MSARITTIAEMGKKLFADRLENKLVTDLYCGKCQVWFGWQQSESTLCPLCSTHCPEAAALNMAYADGMRSAVSAPAASVTPS